jgi:hypothetical protein
MRPRGPLPPRVYWTRRLALVALLALLVPVLWWLLPGLGGSGNAAGSPADQSVAKSPTAGGSAPTGGAGTTTPPPTGQPTTRQPTTTPQTTTPQTTAVRPSAGGSSTGQGTGTGTGSTSAKTTLVPTGPCDASNVVLAVVVDSAPVGKGTTVGLKMSTADGTACSLGISPHSVEARVVSVPATIWQSSGCPDAFPAKNVVVGPHASIVYSFHWDGQLHGDSCGPGERAAAAGGYWAEAALIGGEPNKAYFEVTSPAHSAKV